MCIFLLEFPEDVKVQRGQTHINVHKRRVYECVVMKESFPFTQVSWNSCSSPSDSDVMWCSRLIYCGESFILSDSVTPGLQKRHISDRAEDNLNIDKI